jgi:hypothetical protein
MIITSLVLAETALWTFIERNRHVVAAIYEGNTNSTRQNPVTRGSVYQLCPHVLHILLIDSSLNEKRVTKHRTAHSRLNSTDPQAVEDAAVAMLCLLQGFVAVALAPTTGMLRRTGRHGDAAQQMRQPTTTVQLLAHRTFPVVIVA